MNSGSPQPHGPLGSPRNGTERQYDFNSRGLGRVDEGSGDSVVRWWAKDRVIDTEIGLKSRFLHTMEGEGEDNKSHFSW